MSQPKDNPGYVDQDYLKTLGQQLTIVKQHSYELMRVQIGQQVLDVGCGPGTDTIPLARIVGSEGRVVGIDYDQEMIKLAKEKAEEAGVADWVNHEQADATALSYEDNTFDSCRSERVFQHLPNSDALLSEMIRVTKPKGWIVVIDPDFSNLSVDTKEFDIEWKIRRFITEKLHNGYSGRQLYRQFRQQKLEEVAMEITNWQTTDYKIANLVGFTQYANAAHEAKIINAEERDRWLSDLKRADDEGHFFVYMSLFILTGRKPSI